jgi:hypothetical protein
LPSATVAEELLMKEGNASWCSEIKPIHDINESGLGLFSDLSNKRVFKSRRLYCVKKNNSAFF